MTTPPNPDNWLMGGGTASAKFPTPGTTVGGEIVSEPELRQQTEYKTGELKFFPKSNDPMMQLVVRVQTADRDPERADDDGVRAIYVKGQMQRAVRDAVRKAGADGLRPGGTLTVTYTHDEASKGGGDPAKQYSASYVAPNPSAGFLGTAPAAQPAAPTPAATDRSPEAYLKARGMDPATFGPGADLASIVALMQQTAA